MKHKKNVSSLLLLSVIFTATLTNISNQNVKAEGFYGISTYRTTSLKNSSFTVDILGSGAGALNGVVLGKNVLLQKLKKEARKNVYEYIRDLFYQKKRGTVNVSSNGNIRFIPCTKCSWPSVGER